MQPRAMAPQDVARSALDRARRRIEGDPADRRVEVEGGEHQRTVGADAHVPDGRRRRRDGDRIAGRPARRLVDRDAPEVHRAAAVARKVQEAPVARPRGIPVARFACSDLHPRAASERLYPHVAICAGEQRSRCIDRESPESHETSIGRHARVDGVRRGDPAPASRGDVDRPYLARRLTPVWVATRFGAVNDFAAVRCPGRIGSAVDQPSHTLAVRVHHEQPVAVIAGRRKGD